MRKIEVKQAMGQEGLLRSALKCLSDCATCLSVQSILSSR